MNRLYLPAILILLLFSACGEEKPSVVEDEIVEPDPIVITDHSEHTELFVEFDPFVLDEPSTFLAHFTHMDTFKAFKKGRVDACLLFDDQKKECFSVDAPAFEGIFKPVAIPTQSGNAQLSISVEYDGNKVTHKLGTFKVYEEIKQVPPASHEEDDDAISYLKEQQWKVDYATEVVKRHVLRESVSTFAKVELPSNNEYLLSAPVSGIITLGSKTTIGTQVKKNRPVAYIVPLLGQKEDISTLRFERKKASTYLNLKRKENERLQQLKAKGAVSHKRLIVAEQEYEMAKARLVNIEQRLNQLDMSHDEQMGVALRSPIDGDVLRQFVIPGAYVKEGDPIVHIADSDMLWLNINIPQNDIPKIGSPLGVELQLTDTPLLFTVGEDAKTIYFNKFIDPKTRTASLLFEIDNASSRLSPGAVYAAKAYTGKVVEALAIPKSSIVNDNGRHVVYVQVGGESLERRDVQTGLSDSGHIEVLSGVSEGERIVSKGAYQILLSVVSPAAVGHGHGH